LASKRPAAFAAVYCHRVSVSARQKKRQSGDTMPLVHLLSMA